MRFRFCLTAAFTAAVAFQTAPSAAQMAVTTFGATDAAQCYDNANNDFSEDTRLCDDALKRGDLSRDDRKKTLVNRGIILNRQGALQAAFDDFNAALEIDASLAEAYLNRGNTFFLSRLYDEALADYEKALSLDVKKPWAAWYNIGLAHEGKKDSAAARAAYGKALEENPAFSPAQTKLAALPE